MLEHSQLIKAGAEALPAGLQYEVVHIGHDWQGVERVAVRIVRDGGFWANLWQGRVIAQATIRIMDAYDVLHDALNIEELVLLSATARNDYLLQQQLHRTRELLHS